MRGWQVAPAEIESVLLSHPEIIVATVLGVPDANGTGEVPSEHISFAGLYRPLRQRLAISNPVSASRRKTSRHS